MATASGRKLKYFFVTFQPGSSKPPPTGGQYQHRKGYVGGAGVSAGDVLLLYENLGASGIGIVTDVEIGGEQERILYHYLPLCHPISWASQNSLLQTVTTLHTPLAYIGNWLQEISSGSFRAVVAGRQIDWP